MDLINRIGSSTIAQYLYSVWQYLNKGRLETLKLQVQKERLALSKLSAMDDFATWARQRRSVDKISAEYDAEVSAQQMGKTKFELGCSLGIKALTYITYALVCFWYYKAPMFYIPTDWIGEWPSYILSLPFSPANSVSLTVWLMVLKQIK